MFPRARYEPALMLLLTFILISSVRKSETCQKPCAGKDRFDCESPSPTIGLLTPGALLSGASMARSRPSYREHDTNQP